MKKPITFLLAAAVLLSIAGITMAQGDTSAASTAPFVGHKGSKKVHSASCRFAQQMADRNKAYFKTYKEAVDAGYVPCKVCKPDQMAAIEAPSQTGETKAAAASATEYWASKNGKKFHRPTCTWAQKITEKNLVKYKTKEEALAAGKEPCKVCKP